MKDIERLAAIGFKMLPGGSRPRLALADGTAVREERLERFAAIAGRLSNVAYMARAVDRLDGVAEPAPGTSDGDRQFAHLVAVGRSTAGDHPVALIYVALRRLERAGDFARLRAGLAILLAFDDGELCGAVAVDAVWRPEWNDRTSVLALPATAPALADA